jgi:peptidoglycan/xylan/chitin deacetylase (PgdA/CDA1 family)
MSHEGHEVAIHGWSHRCTAAVPPTRLGRELSAARRTVEDITGTPVTWYRPPYGVLTTETLLATRGLDLRTVLWTAWGRDWERSATPSRIVATVLRRLRPGGTILLHDTDQHARGDWRNTLEATAALLDGHLEAANVGPLRQHWRIPTQ